MAKISDPQVDVKISAGGSTQVHSPSGMTPAHGADAPVVFVKAPLPSGGAKAVIGSGLRFANPA